MTVTEHDLKHILTPGDTKPERSDPKDERKRAEQAGIRLETLRARMYRLMKEGASREEALEKSLAKAIQKKPWTTADINRLIEMRDDDLTARECAEALGRTQQAVESRLALLRATGVIETTKPRWSEEENQRLAQLYRTHTGREVADKLGRTYDTVARQASLLGIKRGGTTPAEPTPSQAPNRLAASPAP